MGKYRRRLSILLIMAMIFTTLSFAVVSAEELPSGSEEAVTEQTDEVSAEEETAEEPAEEAVEEEPAEEAVEEEVVEEEVTENETATEPEVSVEEETVEEVNTSEPLMAGSGVDASITVSSAKLVSYEGGYANILVKWNAKGFGSSTTFSVTPHYNGKTAKVRTTTKNNYTVKLSPGNTYTFTVSASVKDDSGKAHKITSEESAAVATKKAAVANLKAHPSYNAVVLDWTKNSAADHYVIYKGGTEVATVTNAENESPYKNTRVLYLVGGLTEFTSYTFKVVAYYDSSTAGESASVKSQPVRPIRYKVSIKSGAGTTLNKKRGSGPSTYSLKGGQTVQAVGFNGGKYVFEYKGSVFNIAKSRVSSVSANYTKEFNYDKISAETYVNRKGLTSSTSQLIWISTYTQRIYVFTGSKGKWTLKYNWDVSTGKASSPTPTGNNFLKAVWKKISSRHNLPWWTCFSSYNAMHSLFKSWVKKLGTPASGGCVRNPVSKAKWIYKNVKMNTTVFVR